MKKVAREGRCYLNKDLPLSQTLSVYDRVMLYIEMVAGLETFGLDEQQTIVNALEEVAEGVGKGCAAQRRADDNSKRTVSNDRVEEVGS